MEILELLTSNQWLTSPPATPEQIQQLTEAFKIELPDDYVAVLSASNGCSLENFAAQLIIWSTKEVIAMFREHDLYENIPESLIFGSDGGGTLYCYDLRTKDNKGTYEVFLVKEEEAFYNKIFYRTSSLTELVRHIVNNEPVNLDIQ